jgi:hypothetical protein
MVIITTLPNNWIRNMKTQNMIEMLETATPVLEALSTLFVFLIGLLVLFIIIVFIFDISQRKNAVLRNYPVVGHFLPDLDFWLIQTQLWCLYC